MLCRDSVPVFAPGAVVDSAGAGAGDTAGAVAGVASREMPKRPDWRFDFEQNHAAMLLLSKLLTIRNWIHKYVLPAIASITWNSLHFSSAPWEAELVPEANGSKVS